MKGRQKFISWRSVPGAEAGILWETKEEQGKIWADLLSWRWRREEVTEEGTFELRP